LRVEHGIVKLPENSMDDGTNIVEWILVEPVAKGIWKTVSHYSKIFFV